MDEPVKPRQKRKYDRYNALDIALRKSRIESSGKVAGLLLDTFTENAGILTAAQAQDRGLCGDKKGDFSSWRQSLIDAGWIEWDYARAKRTGDLSRHFPTEKLLKYLNADIIKRQQVATTEQLYQGLAELAAKADRIELETQRDKIGTLEAKVEALEQRLTAFEAREAHYLSALRNAAALLLETSDSGAIEAFVKTMLKAAAEGGAEEEAAPLSRTLLAN